MRVLYDHQIFTWQNFGGISRYFADLLEAFSADSSRVAAALALRYSDNAYVPDLASLRGKVRRKDAYRAPFPFHLLGSKCPRRFNPSRANLEHACAELAGGAFDLFHPTYYEPYFLDALGKKPFVLTVYDMIHELFPEHYFGQNTFREKAALLRRATHILAISQSTKKDLMQLHGLPSEKISVVHLGSSFGPETHAPARLELPEKFLLYVGLRAKYKNCYFLWRALAEVLKTEPGLRLICAGGGALEEPEIAFLRALEIEDRVIHHEASTRSLVTLYQRAQALIFPSLYEGFGLPVVEAFNCRCPVLASRTPALEEVGGDAVLYFEPKSPPSLQEQVRRLLRDQELRAALKNRGAGRGRDFSPARCARETAAVYAKILGRN